MCGIGRFYSVARVPWENDQRPRSSRSCRAATLQVVEFQKDVFELEQQREGPEPPADLEDQIQRKSDALKDARGAVGAH